MPGTPRHQERIQLQETKVPAKFQLSIKGGGGSQQATDSSLPPRDPVASRFEGFSAQMPAMQSQKQDIPLLFA